MTPILGGHDYWALASTPATDHLYLCKDYRSFVSLECSLNCGGAQASFMDSLNHRSASRCPQSRPALVTACVSRERSTLTSAMSKGGLSGDVRLSVCAVTLRLDCKTAHFPSSLSSAEAEIKWPSAARLSLFHPNLWWYEQRAKSPQNKEMHTACPVHTWAYTYESIQRYRDEGEIKMTTVWLDGCPAHGWVYWVSCRDAAGTFWTGATTPTHLKARRLD